jgi:hypothetical protein
VALKAVELDEYDDHFFNLMPVLFPYNKFTMSVSLFIYFILGSSELARSAEYHGQIEAH